MGQATKKGKKRGDTTTNILELETTTRRLKGKKKRRIFIRIISQSSTIEYQESAFSNYIFIFKFLDSFFSNKRSFVKVTVKFWSLQQQETIIYYVYKSKTPQKTFLAWSTSS